MLRVSASVIRSAMVPTQSWEQGSRDQDGRGVR